MSESIASHSDNLLESTRYESGEEPESGKLGLFELANKPFFDEIGELP